MTPSTIPSETLFSAVDPHVPRMTMTTPTLSGRSPGVQNEMTIKCEFCQSPNGEETAICMSCFEAGRSQAPDASYSRLVQATDALVKRLDELAWLAEQDGSWFRPPDFRELAAVKDVMREIF